jgi:hypothetical protein
MRAAFIGAGVAALLAAGGALFLGAQTPRQRTDPIAKLSQRLEQGEATLEYKGRFGYLESLLKELDIHPDSQVLVFSRTSLQQDKINPKSPRAIYFNDTVQVGYVQNGTVFELVAADPIDGLAFYTLPTQRTDRPRFDTDRSLCIACHGYAWVSQAFVANTYPGVDGTPAFLGGDLFHVTTHRTPFEERWGGWYVTGTHGKMRHLGNAVARNPYRPIELETENTQNLTRLDSKFDTSQYLTPHSDIVALMTLEHQTRAVYLMTALSAQFRAAASPEFPAARRPTEATLNAAVEDLVSYLTFADEIELTSPIKGTSTFTQTFPKRGPRDSKGRSLRDFNLKTRLFEYPLSYMLYTDIFDTMHPVALERVSRRLYEVLSGQDQSPAFARLPLERRRAALEIVRATKPNLPDYWRR